MGGLIIKDSFYRAMTVAVNQSSLLQAFTKFNFTASVTNAISKQNSLMAAIQYGIDIILCWEVSRR